MYKLHFVHSLFIIICYYIGVLRESRNSLKYIPLLNKPLNYWRKKSSNRLLLLFCYNSLFIESFLYKFLTRVWYQNRTRVSLFFHLSAEEGGGNLRQLGFYGCNFCSVTPEENHCAQNIATADNR